MDTIVDILQLGVNQRVSHFEYLSGDYVIFHLLESWQGSLVLGISVIVDRGNKIYDPGSDKMLTW